MKASAVKRGRNPQFPYVPVVVFADGRTQDTNTKSAFATRAEAVAFAQLWVDAARARGRVTYDSTAGVYEAWADPECQKHLGCYDSIHAAHVAIKAAAQS